MLAADPSMIMPLPNDSWAWMTVSFSPGTTICFVKPKVSHSHSMARARRGSAGTG